MSNTHVESEVFAEVLKKAAGVNPKLLFVDCAQSGGDGAVTSNPDANYWKPLPPANQSEMIHNPRFGLFLKEKMDALGIECVFRTPKDYPSGGARPFSGEMADFLAKHFR